MNTFHIEDIHTHRRDASPGSVLSLSLTEYSAIAAEIPADRPLSVGFHPWDLADAEPSPDDWHRLELALADSRVIAVGECGFDLLRGGPLFRQVNVFMRQAEMAEARGLPMVIHCVRAHDHIIAAHKELRPKCNWVVHGFRGKPQIARMLLGEGLWLSLGEHFNAEARAVIPADRLLVETDESPLSISEIAARVGISDEQATDNAGNFFFGKC